jgi:hypothetical protein
MNKFQGFLGIIFIAACIGIGFIYEDASFSFKAFVFLALLIPFLVLFAVSSFFELKEKVVELENRVFDLENKA